MNGCEPLRDRLPGAVDGDLDDDLRSHAAVCLRCQAEIAQYKRLARALRSLERQLAVVPLGLHAEVMRAMAEAQGRNTFLRKGALLGAGGLLVAAGTTAGILLSRHRHRAAS